jgi:hypothetical protein
MRPVVLLVTSCRWFATARIAIAFAEAGCQIDIVCPTGHPVGKTEVVRRQFTYRGLRPLSSIQRAIASSKPSLIIPCDDRAIADLLRLATTTDDASIRSAIEKSLGRPDGYKAMLARSAMMRLTNDAGGCVPETAEVADMDSLRAWLTDHGFPAYLKVDGTSGGVGVIATQNWKDAENAFNRLSKPPELARVLKRIIVNRDATHVLPFLKRIRPLVNVQKAIVGPETNSAIACWQGKLLAGIHVEVLERQDSAGHATVLRVIDNKEMQDIAEKVAQRLHLSGLFGLDYIIDRNSGRAYLIEMNVRATQTCHLRLGPGRSPIASLAAAMAAASSEDVKIDTKLDTIALFPQEWKRNPASHYLREAFHDIPWSYPGLIRSSIKWRLEDQKILPFSEWFRHRKLFKTTENNSEQQNL